MLVRGPHGDVSSRRHLVGGSPARSRAAWLRFCSLNAFPPRGCLSESRRSYRLADTQNSRDRRTDAGRKVATRGVPRKSLDFSVDFPNARRLWRVVPSDGNGLAMMANGPVGTDRAGAALGTPFSDMLGRRRRCMSPASDFSWIIRSRGWGRRRPERRPTMHGASRTATATATATMMPIGAAPPSCPQIYSYLESTKLTSPCMTTPQLLALVFIVAHTTSQAGAMCV
eukprot:COSAG02_NODE_5574_length_4220_cov_12.097792_4_plen_227_part_00